MEKLTIREDGQERVVELDIDEITIGRAVENIIQINEKRSSRNHCRIERADEGYRITDLETSNGTRVNGLRIEGAIELKPGDEIEIGDLMIRFGDKPAVDEFAPTIADPTAARQAAPVVAKSGRKKTKRKKQQSSDSRRGDEIDIDEVGERALNWVQRYAVLLFAAGIGLVLIVAGISAVMSNMKETELNRTWAGLVKDADGAMSTDEMSKAADRLSVFQARANDAGFGDKFGALAGKRIDALKAKVKHLVEADEALVQLKLNRKTLDWAASRYYLRLLALQGQYADTPTAEQIAFELQGVAQELREELHQGFLKVRVAVDEQLKARAYPKAFAAIDEYAGNLGQGALSGDAVIADFRGKADGLRTAVRQGMKQDYEGVVEAVKDSLAAKNFVQARKSLAGALERFSDTPYAYYIRRDMDALLVMAQRRITSFDEARKISDGRQKHLEQLERARKLIAQRKYEEAGELLEQIARAGGDVAREVGQQQQDIRRFLALRAKLIDQINTGQLRQNSYQFANQQMTIVKASNERVHLRIGTTGSTARTWTSLTPRELYDFFLRMDLQPKDWETIGIFCFYHDLVPQGHLALIQAMKLDSRSSTTRNRVFELYARLSGTPKPAEGFVVYAERIMTPREKEMRVTEEQAAKLASAMTSGAKDKRDAAYREFKRLLDNAGSKYGGTFAKELQSNIVKKLQRERQVLLAELKNGAGLGNINQLRALKTELNKRRAHAKALIFDTKAYPYDACHGCKAQPEVDKRVNAVKELWDNPFNSGLIGGGVKAKSERIAQINDQLKGLGVNGDTGGLNLGYIAALANKKMNIQNFGINGKEQKVIAYNHRVFDENEKMKSAATSAEKKQVQVTNEYRHMMGHHCVYIDDRLVKAARGHSSYMQSSGKFAHEIPGHPDGASPSERVRKAGYTGGASENISMGRSGPKEVHNAWYNSSGHHRNLLNDGWRVMGAGQAGNYWTQNFGATR